MGPVCSRQPVFRNQVAEKLFFVVQEQFENGYPGGQKAVVVKQAIKRVGQHLRLVPPEATMVALDLSDLPLGDEGVSVVCKIIGEEQLVNSLDMSNCGLTAKGVAELAGHLRTMSKLKHIYLSDNDIGPSGLESILGAYGSLSTVLETLGLRNTGVTDDFVFSISQDLYCNQVLRSLDLSNNVAISPSAVKALHAALTVNNYIRSVNLTNLSGIPPDILADIEHITSRNDVCGQVMRDILVACTDWNNILEYRLSTMRANNQQEEETKQPPKEPEGRITVGYAETKGVREHMEDETVIMMDFFKKGHALFGIFDGHGGSECSKYLAKHFPHVLRRQLQKDSSNPSQCLVSTCEEIDQMIRDCKVPNGSCALVAYIDNVNIYCCSVGDSRAVLGMNQTTLNASKPITPGDPDEKKRIEAAGGFVSESNRVNGVLAVSRAFGDIPLQPILLPKPEMTVLKLSGPAMLTMGCDGVWDVLSADQVVMTGRRCKNPRKAARAICNGAFHQGSLDNITVLCILIRDDHGNTKF